MSKRTILSLKQQEFFSALENLKSNEKRLDWLYLEVPPNTPAPSSSREEDVRRASDGIEMVTLNVQGVEYHQLRETKTKEELFAELETLTTNIEKFNLIKKVSKEQFYKFENHDEKNDALAEVYRTRGHLLVREDKLEAAIMSFTSSLVVAQSQEQKALAFADRSLVLFRWSMMEHCITDIDRALMHNYPIDKTELLERRRRTTNRQHRPPRYYDTCPLIFSPNEKIQSGHESIDIAYDQKFGRHIVANEEIPIGSLLLVEEPIVSMIFKGDYLHCHQCCTLTYNPIPCDNCTQVVYCGENCKSKAQDYHQYECVIIRKLKPELGMFDFLVLKLTLQMKDEYGQFNTLDENERYRSDRFNEVYNLQHNFDLAASKVLHKMVLFYRILKQYTNFFESSSQRKAFKDLIITNIGIDLCNSTTLTEMRGKMDRVDFGQALYPAMSLFNHSCYPNVAVIHYGKTVVLKSLQTIKGGEQCFICYKYWHDRASVQIRQKVVPFCECQPCVEKWPIRLTRLPDTLTTGWMMSVFADDILKSQSLIFVKKNLWSCINQLKESEQTLTPQERSILCKAVELCLQCCGNIRPE